MEAELLWLARQELSRPAIYVAPSWSWASLDGCVEPTGHYEDEHWELEKSGELYVHLIDVHVKPCGNDPLGEICDGNISLSCRTLIFVALHPNNSPSPFGGTKIMAKIKDKDTFMVFDAIVFWDCKEFLEEAYLLPVEGLISGLVIVPTGKAQGQYRRVGMFRPIWHMARVHIQELARILLDTEHSAGIDAFAGFTEDSGYEKEHWVLILCSRLGNLFTLLINFWFIFGQS